MSSGTNENIRTYLENRVARSKKGTILEVRALTVDINTTGVCTRKKYPCKATTVSSMICRLDFVKRVGKGMYEVTE